MTHDPVTSICRIWSRLLATPIGPNDDFFTNGGYSLLLIEMILQAEEEGLAIDPEQVFDHPTPAALAAVVSTSSQVLR